MSGGCRGYYCFERREALGLGGSVNVERLASNGHRPNSKELADSRFSRHIDVHRSTAGISGVSRGRGEDNN